MSKQSALSRRGAPRVKSAKRIIPKSLTKSEVAGFAKKERAALDSSIDLSDIPELTKDQLAEFRPASPRDVITARLDADVMEWLRSFGPGHSARINRILRAVMESSRA